MRLEGAYAHNDAGLYFLREKRTSFSLNARSTKGVAIASSTRSSNDSPRNSPIGSRATIADASGSHAPRYDRQSSSAVDLQAIPEEARS
jgi:hypothetical protein